MIKSINRYIYIVLAFITGLMLVASIFFIPSQNLISMNSSWFSPFLFILLSVSVFLLLRMFYRFISTHKNIVIYVNSVIAVGIAILQILTVKFMSIAVSTDDLRVKAQAFSLAAGDKTWTSYFYVFPNNVNVTVFFSWLIRLVKIFSAQHVSLLIAIFLFVLTDLAIFFNYKSIYLLTKNRAIQSLFLIVTACFLCVYTFALSFYTDPMVIVFPSMSLYFYLRYRFDKSKISSWRDFVIAVLALTIGYVVKPNVIIILIAIVLAVVLEFKSIKELKKEWLTLFFKLGIIVLFLIGGKGATTLVQRENNFTAKPVEEVPSSAFMYMALNPDTDGQISQDMFKFQDIKSVSQRKQEIKVETKKRFRKMGAGVLINHFWRKFVFTFSRGTVDGDFSTLQAYRHAKISGHLKMLVFWAANISQIMYILVLAGLFRFSVNEFLQPSEMGSKAIFPVVSFLGIVSFHTLFWEAEARYAYLTLFFCIVLGSIGLVSCFENDSIIKAAKNNKSLFTIIFSVITLAGFATSQPLTKIVFEERIDAANRPGTTYYLKKPFVLRSRESGKQVFYAKSNFSFIWLEAGIVPNNKVHVKIIDESKHSEKRVDGSVAANGFITLPIAGHAGKYTIEVKNIGTKTEKLYSYNYSPHYNLSDGTNMINGYQNGYSVPFEAYYSVYNSPIKTWQLIFISIISLVFIIWRIQRTRFILKKSA